MCKKAGYKMELTSREKAFELQIVSEIILDAV